MFAAAPAWFSDNLVEIVVGTLLVLTVLVVRMVQKATTRALLVGLIAAVGIFTYSYRAELETCAVTCSCRIAEQDIELPACTSSIGIRVPT